MPIFDPLSIFDPRELHSAIKERGDIDLCKRLLNFGINVNIESETYDKTALHFAAEFGQPEIVKLLLEEGVYPDETDADFTALIHATSSFDKDSVKLLLDYGARRFERDHFEMIHIVAVSGDVKRMKDLLAVENDLEKTGKYFDKLTALHYAARAGNEEIVKILLKNGAIYKNSISNPNILHSAARGGNLRILKMFLELGCDIHEKDSYGNTTLHYAAEGANIEVIKFILRQGINVRVKNDQGRNALFSAVERNRNKIEESVRLLLNLGLKINSTDKEGKTPLDIAVERSLDLSVDVLLKLGAIIHPENLSLACENHCKYAVLLLLKHGANINEKNIEGESALSCALKGDIDNLNYREAIVEILIAHGADVESDKSLLWDLVIEQDYHRFTPAYDHEVNDNYFKNLNGNRAIAKKLLQHGLSSHINLRDDDNCSVLEYAFYYGSPKYINTAFLTPFLDSGLEINEAHGDEGESMIQFALHLGHVHSKILTRHMVKMIHRNQYVSDENLRDIRNNSDLSLLWNKCEEEIDLMKEKRGVYKLFIFQEPHQLAKLANQKGVWRIITFNRHKTMYPIYADHLEEQFEKGTHVLSLLREVNRFFHAVSRSEGNEHLPQLPETNPIFISKIFGYLDIKDLETLAYVCNPRRRQ